MLITSRIVAETHNTSWRLRTHIPDLHSLCGSVDIRAFKFNKQIFNVRHPDSELSLLDSCLMLENRSKGEDIYRLPVECHGSYIRIPRLVQ